MKCWVVDRLVCETTQNLIDQIRLSRGTSPDQDSFFPIAQCLHEFKPSKGELAHREWRGRGADSIIGTNINHHTAPIGHPRHEQV
jgi:hypothetical protein